MNKKDKRTIVSGIAFLLICLIGIGYAAIESNLEINGTAKFKGSNFDVHFENIIVTNGSVEINTTAGDSAATIEPTNRTRVDYSVTLSKPGDFYEFTVDVVNDGTIDAMINLVTSKMNNVVINNNLPNYLEYNVTYIDDAEITQNHELNATQTEIYKVRVAFRDDINPSDLPTTTSTLNFSFEVQYVQRSSNAVTRERAIVYRISSIYVNIGSSASDIGDILERPEEAINAFGHPYFLRHKISSGVVSESYVGFVVDGIIYYLRGGAGEEGFAAVRPIYDENVRILNKAIGSEHCYTTSNSTADFYMCTLGNLSVYAGSDGYVNANNTQSYCCVYSVGSSYCGNYG